jgi:hypothetical protein
VPKTKGSMRGNRRDGLRALPGPRTKARGGGGDTPFESKSSGHDEEGEDEEEGLIISSPHSTPPESLPSPGDLFGQQMGIPASAHQAK